ncbi:MAG: T9SS type A sorting domain-containing protein, partial [Candidatus Cloacimonadaceae bacterium]|nr:T9SS type A sorting domain-containing protein [Candidatus Cloacimonadaceae bacterium]
CLLGFAHAQDDRVIIDTLYAEYPLTNTIYYNMQTGVYRIFSNYTSLQISYGRSSWDDPGIQESRGFVTFTANPAPNGYYIQSAEIRAYCWWYVADSYSWTWPDYYATPYQVMLDHIEYDSFTPAVFGQTALESDIAVLQDSAYIGWLGTDVTGSYLDDIQQSRVYSQYRIRFPAGYDVSGYDADLVSYSRGPNAGPRLIVTYLKDVSNSDEVSPAITGLIKRMYPMPAHSVINIELDGKLNSTASVLVYDIKGRLVRVYRDLHIANDPLQLQLPDCPSGIYFIRVDNGTRSQVKKITLVR